VELVLAAVITLAATPVAAIVARRTGIVDRPGPLKTHLRPVPYLGGAAVFLGLGAGLLLAGLPELLVPLALALALGIVDDARPMPPAVRLAAEAVIGASAGFVAPGDLPSRVLAAIFVVMLLNAVNLLDGQDGLATSVGLVSALGFAWIGGDARALGLALAGALAAFLVFNRPPARIYLGDGGAYLLGTALALAPALEGGGAGEWSVWFAAPLVVAIPLVDTAIAVLRRARTGAPLLAGDRSHLYDQLVDRGLGVTASTAVCAAAQVVFTLIGVLLAFAAAPVALAGTAVVTVAVLGVAARSGLLGARDG